MNRWSKKPEKNKLDSWSIIVEGWKMMCLLRKYWHVLFFSPPSLVGNYFLFLAWLRFVDTVNSTCLWMFLRFTDPSQLSIFVPRQIWRVCAYNRNFALDKRPLDPLISCKYFAISSDEAILVGCYAGASMGLRCAKSAPKSIPTLTINFHTCNHRPESFPKAKLLHQFYKIKTWEELVPSDLQTYFRC